LCTRKISPVTALMPLTCSGDESERSPAMMSVGLHPRLIGRPGRIAGLEKFLEHVQARGRTWFARRMDIAHHWRELMGLAAWKERSAGREG
jgi:allantoinase